MEDSSQTVIKETEDEEDVVKASKRNEEVVERVLHFFRGKNVHGKGVSDETKDCNRDLKDVHFQSITTDL